MCGGDGTAKVDTVPVRSANQRPARSSRSLSTTTFGGGPFTPLRTGLDHLAFAVADEAMLSAWSRHLDELGIGHDPIDDRGAVVSMTFKDPDGIALECYHLRPR